MGEELEFEFLMDDFEALENNSSKEESVNKFNTDDKNPFAHTFIPALEAEDDEEGEDPDETSGGGKDNDPDAPSNDKENKDEDNQEDPDAPSNEDEKGSEDDSGDKQEDPDFTKGSDPDASGSDNGNDPDAASDSNPPNNDAGNVEQPKTEEDKESKEADIGKRIHLYRSYNRLSKLVEGMINNIQFNINSAVSLEDRHILSKVKQSLIKTSGQIEFAMALDFQKMDYDKIEELYNIINEKIKKFISAIEKTRKNEKNGK